MYGQNFLVTCQADSKYYICCEFPDLSVIANGKMYCIDENYWIYLVKRSFLSVLNLWKKAVCDV